MNARELEWQLDEALRRMTSTRRAILRNAGIIDPPVPIGFCANVRSAGGRYDPFGESGRCGFILPVRAAQPDTPECIPAFNALRDGTLIDLLCFHPKQPNKWALRLGEAEWLGSIPPQRLNPEPVRLRPNPTEWLRHDCDGLVILNRDDSLAEPRILCGAEVRYG